MLNSVLEPDTVDLINPSPWGRTRLAPALEGASIWEYGNMKFQTDPIIDPLPTHQGSLRLLRSEVCSPSGGISLERDVIKIFDEECRSLSSCMSAAVYRPVNLEDYLSQGLGIVSRLPEVSKQTTQFVSAAYARHLALEATKVLIELGSIFCGEGITEILSVVSGDTNAADQCIDSAMKSHVGRVICVKLTDICRRVAAEYDAMASTMSLNEASSYLLSRFTGNGRIVSLTKLLLRTGNLLSEDSRNFQVVERGLNASLRSFSFLWGDSMVEARALIDIAKHEVIGPATQGQELQDLDFWELVDQLSQFVSRPRISLDAVVAVALAERGVVLNCHAEGISVFRAIAGNDAPLTRTPVSMTNPGSVWVNPFRALTVERIVLALDGRTKLRMTDELAGVRHTLALFETSISNESQFLCCEPLPYAHVGAVKSTMPKAFAALARDAEPWNDGLQKELEHLSARKVPPDGVEVARVVTAARECYLRQNVLAKEYACVIFSVKRIIRVFTLAVEQGRRMGDILYQYSLLMVHPDVSRIDGRRVREVWDDVENAPEGLRRFIENVRLTYEGWMVYPETGSAGVRQVRRKYTNHDIVWLGFHK